MSDNAKNSNTNGQVPRIVKGTGFFTPMDLAPGEAPAGVNAPQTSPASEKLSIGLSTPMNLDPAETTTQQPSAQPPQSGDGNNAKDS